MAYGYSVFYPCLSCSLHCGNTNKRFRCSVTNVTSGQVPGRWSWSLMEAGQVLKKAWYRKGHLSPQVPRGKRGILQDARVRTRLWNQAGVLNAVIWSSGQDCWQLPSSILSIHLQRKDHQVLVSSLASQNTDYISQPSLQQGVAHNYVPQGYVLPLDLFCFMIWLEYGWCHEPLAIVPTGTRVGSWSRRHLRVMDHI